MLRTFFGVASLTLNWVQLAAIVGALQGLFLTGVLIAQLSNRTANRLLAGLTLTFTIYLASGVYYTSGLLSVFPSLFGVSYLTPWMFGPLVYVYAMAASDASWRFTPRQLVHFVPVVIVLVLEIPMFSLSGPEKVALWERWITAGITPPLGTIDPLRYASGISYSAATVLFLRSHRRDVEHSYSNVAHVNLRWLLRLSAATGSLWVVATAFKITHTGFALRDGTITLAMALLVYGIGYMGLRQPEILRHATIEPMVVAPAGHGVLSPAAPVPSPYERSGLSEQEATVLRTSLLTVMEREQPWRDSDLTLSDLAERLNSTPHKLSELLNAQLGRTFYDFVNGYRVREVQRRIAAGDARSLKMLALALDAGFASKSTFNEVFKKHTRQTPSGFRQALGA